ncbi:hypothetical protein [Streptomyces sp. NPDC047141]|uniref:hypothetical protein n=1 Tax=Streptomyces sp. NPDC047141 TaxID=3155738 RepID=UPI0033FA5593
MKLVQAPLRGVVPLTATRIEQLTNAMDKECRALVILAVGSGLRTSELLGLQVLHVDFRRLTIKAAQ